MICARVHGDCMHAFRPRMEMHGIACTSSTLKRERVSGRFDHHQDLVKFVRP